MTSRLTWAALLALVVGLAGAGLARAVLVSKPVTKGLGHGAIYQPPLDKRSCYGSSPKVKVGGHTCTTITQLTNASAETKPAVAADSRALYVAAQSGVLVLKRDASGGLAADSCLVLVGGCGQAENDEGADVSEVVLGPDGRQLYVLLDRQRDGGVEIHAMPIGADDRLSMDASCLLLIPPSDAGLPVSNPRNCRVAEGENHVSAYGLALTPNGRFAYVLAIAHGVTVAGIVEMARAADGSLSVLPGCVSTTGGRGRDPAQCETLLPVAQADQQVLNPLQLAISLDSATLVVRGEDVYEDDRGFLVRFAINADGSLTRGTAATACVNATGNNGCLRSPALAGEMSPMAIAGGRVYVGAATYVPSNPDIFTSRIVGFTLAGDGGLSLPAGAAGCVGNITRTAARIKKIGSCSIGREALRHPAGLVVGSDGKTLYSVGYLVADSRGIALLRVGGGAPKPVSGPTGCFQDGTIFAMEKTPCNKPFALGTLANAEYTFTLSPDGRAAYVLARVLNRAGPIDHVRVNVLRRIP